jgi:biotin transport system substrate-specific component
MAADGRSGSLVNVSLSNASSAAGIRIAAVALAVALTAAAAQVSVPLPFTPVPFVLTPLAVLRCGAALGSRLGAAAQVAYLIAGAAGLPVFAPSTQLPPGALRLMGPTGGYLMAYPIAAFVTGYLADRGWDRRYWTSVAAMLLGLAVIFAGGVSWLTAMFTHSVGGAVTLGLRWFVALDVLKVLGAAMILPQAWRLIGRPSIEAGRPPSTTKHART